MLEELAEHFETLIKYTKDQPIVIEPEELIVLCTAARLLIQIHNECDKGALDGVDLDWMVEADDLILGEECGN
jgi:hypothetical protein